MPAKRSLRTLSRLVPMKSIAPLFSLTLLALTACSSTPATPTLPPDVVGREVSYHVGDVACTGYLAIDHNRTGPRPGVLIVHEWWGHNDYVRHRADMLAAEGYTAFALDMYGDGKRAEHPDDAGRFAAEVMQNLPVGVARFEAGRRVLEQQPETDPKHIAAIGYCFGGGIVMEMVRRGEVLDLAASFHGSLGTQHPAEPGAVKTKTVLVCHGGADKLVPIEQIAAVEKEMHAAGCQNITTVVYPQAMHGFTNPDATAKGKQFGLPIAYDAAADRASWQTLLAMLRGSSR